jgi:hypothetical protein
VVAISIIYRITKKLVYEMTNKRSGKDRRIDKDRRKGDNTSYNGPGNRGTRYQRSDKDRREINRNLFMNKILSPGNESRRSGIDQREFSYAGIIPERRSGKDRRRFI